MGQDRLYPLLLKAGYSPSAAFEVSDLPSVLPGYKFQVDLFAVYYVLLNNIAMDEFNGWSGFLAVILKQMPPEHFKIHIDGMYIL